MFEVYSVTLQSKIKRKASCPRTTKFTRFMDHEVHPIHFALYTCIAYLTQYSLSKQYPMCLTDIVVLAGSTVKYFPGKTHIYDLYRWTTMTSGVSS